MAGHDAGRQHQFTGFHKSLNAEATTGRRNYVIATYAGIAAMCLFFKLKSKKKEPEITENKLCGPPLGQGKWNLWISI
ncbi:ATP synthase membrane subunit DAPIT, mitochondrial-like [Scyliorhinus canicula]|uniref:ATP synthase membrane subunit DAPIT, mitochondrial-like n=1 Tax=Scyliorhinus canicula TaxID=7830 RepID=UPI0018F39107|nr:ATP synthase membrane subunit DAPIT, mitochondrial-like [Scyliorhinus canicula]